MSVVLEMDEEAVVGCGFFWVEDDTDAWVSCFCFCFGLMDDGWISGCIFFLSQFNSPLDHVD